MKKIAFLIIFLWLSTISVIHAQLIRETSASMSLGHNNAIMLELDYADASKVLEVFDKYVNDFKAKTKTKKGELFADNALIKSIAGNNTIDIYARAEKGMNKAVLTVWFDLGGAYLSSRSHPDKYLEAEKWLYEFAKIMVKKGIEDELKAEQKRLSELENDLKNLTREKEKLERNITSDEKSIKDMENKIAQTKQNIEKSKQDIITNLDQQRNKNDEIEKQKEVIKKVEAKLKGN